ncbi:MAG: terminase [Alphaproteobacteria bacterium]|nr:MAG: terminase [Alphaproteobacteria bacterium]
MTKIEEKTIHAALRSDFTAFCYKAISTLHPEIGVLPSWHIEAIAHHLMQLGKTDTRRLIINLPPRQLKSTILTAWAAYLMGHNPALRIIVACYNDSLTRKQHRDFRKVLESSWYRKAFPQMAGKPIKDTETEYVTAQQGYRFATSVSGTLTGRGADILIVDDPIKADNAFSEVERNNVNEWAVGTLFSRLDDPAKGIIVVAMQRLHQNDLSGFLLAKPGYEGMIIPSIAPKDELPFALGEGRFHRRQENETIQPNRLSHGQLMQIREEMGSIIFSAQHQQQPVPEEGLIFKAEYFKDGFLANAFPPMEEIVISWDTGSKTGSHNDYSVATVWGIRGKFNYLLHVQRERLEYPMLEHRINQLAVRYKACTVLIEDAALGTALIQSLHKYAKFNVIGIKPKDDKIIRARIASAAFEAGKVMTPTEALWKADYLAEMLGFPNTKYDDQVDSTTQYLLWRNSRYEIPVVGPYFEIRSDVGYR